MGQCFTKLKLTEVFSYIVLLYSYVLYFLLYKIETHRTFIPRGAPIWVFTDILITDISATKLPIPIPIPIAIYFITFVSNRNK